MSNERQTLISMFTYAQEYLLQRIQNANIQQYKDEYERELNELQDVYVKLIKILEGSQ